MTALRLPRSVVRLMRPLWKRLACRALGHDDELNIYVDFGDAPRSIPETKVDVCRRCGRRRT